MYGYTKQLKKMLKKNGCYFVRSGKGDHEIWFIIKINLRINN